MEITLYTLSTCPFCMQATALLQQLDKPFTLHEMDADPSGLAAAKSEWGHPTVPIVIIDGELVGGFTELQGLAAAGKLA